MDVFEEKLRIAIITQTVDIADTDLGFFHNWIKTFAKRCEKVFVICLKKGELDLPQNVRVFELGKDKWSRFNDFSHSETMWRRLKPSAFGSSSSIRCRPFVARTIS